MVRKILGYGFSSFVLAVSFTIIYLLCFGSLAWAAETSLAVNAVTGTHGGKVTLTATLTSGGSPLSGKPVTFYVNSRKIDPVVITDSSGVAVLAGVSLEGINTGVFPSGIEAVFAGDNENGPALGKADLTVNSPVIEAAGVTGGNLSNSLDSVEDNVVPVSKSSSIMSGYNQIYLILLGVAVIGIVYLVLRHVYLSR